jgi:hypothetical protein
MVLMIKKFKQFNEELSPELLNRAAKAAYDRNQEFRGNKFYNAAEDASREEINTKKKENYESFMSITGGVLFGYECVVDPLRVNPGGDTWITINGSFRTKKGTAKSLYITDALIKENKVAIIFFDNGDVEQIIDVMDLIIERKDARTYHNFLNWWKGEQNPFSVDDYCIRGIHV